MLRASDLTAFTLLSAEGLEESDNEQDLRGIPETEGECDESVDDEGDVDEEDAGAVGQEGERGQREGLECWGPEHLGEEGANLPAEASSQDEGVESTEAGGQQAAAPGAVDGGGHRQLGLEGLEKLSGLGTPGVIGNLSRLVIDFDAHLKDFKGIALCIVATVVIFSLFY